MPAHRAAALVVLVCAAVPALAGRPLVSEDAGVIDARNCEVEGAFIRQRSAGLLARENSLQLGCGTGWGTQLALRAASTGDGTGSSRAVELNGKTQLASWGDARNPSALALAWALTGNKQAGQALRHAGTTLNAALSTPLGTSLGTPLGTPLGAVATLHLNLGHSHDETAHLGSTSWSLALEHTGLGEGQRWQPMLEVFSTDRDRAPSLNAALRYTALPERLYLDGSLGRQLGGAKATLFTLGFKWTL